MTNKNIPHTSTVSGAVSDTKDEIKGARHHDVLGAHLHGANKEKSSSLETEIFKSNRTPLQGIDLGKIGAKFDFKFIVNPNPTEGFTIRMIDGPESADEMVQYQIMKGGYDGKMKLMIEYHRPQAHGLDDPYITIVMFQKELAIEKICGSIPAGIKPGTLMEWRENAWKEEAKKILRNVNAYNPKTQQVLKLTRKFVQIDLTDEPNPFEKRHEDQHIFREEEIIEVEATDVKLLPKIRYLDNFFICLGEIKEKLGISNKV